MNIVLIGMRGSGKSTVGEFLAAKLGWQYFETDRLIEKKSGIKISDYVDKFGWDSFRELESNVIDSLKDAERSVIATGGGVILNPENMKILKANSITVWLQAGIPTFVSRCRGDKNRPFLTQSKTLEEDFAKTLKLRENLYGRYADFSVLNEDKTKEECAAEIIEKKIFCVIGHPVSHSLSPAMHNSAYKTLGLNCLFLGFDVTDLKSFITCVRDLKIEGVAVTVPHKVKIMEFLNGVDETAKAIGAVNTVINRNGVLTGLNTDWLGALDALKEKTDLSGKKVALIGAGGAARAVAYGLKKVGAAVSVFSRNPQHSQSLSNDLCLENCFPLNQQYRIKDYDIVINATSVGMDENKSPVKKNAFSSKQTVFDVVYSPRMTLFLQMAKDSGCSIITGDRMLLHCVSQQFELFTGHKAPIDILEKSLC